MEGFWCAVVLLVCAFTYESSARTLLIGGGDIRDSQSDIWNRVITLAGGRGSAKIGVLTAASSRPVYYGQKSKALFESYGAEAYWIPVHEGNLTAAMDEEVVKNIKQMTGFYFGGGYQQKYISTLLTKDREPTPVFQQIVSMYNDGTLVTGDSAGAMIMPKGYTVVAGKTYQALINGAHKVGDDVQPSDLLYDSVGGLGLIDGHIIDVHFQELGRHGRLIRLLSDTKDMEKGTPYGIGLDEETALLVTDVGTEKETGEVLGNGGVVFIDTSKSYVDTNSSHYRILNVNAHHLTAGDKMGLRDYTLTVSSKKRPIKGNEKRDYARTSTDIFKMARKNTASEFRLVAESLFDSRFDSVSYGTTLEDNPQFYVLMVEDSNSKGYYEVGDSTKYTYHSLRLEIGSSPEA